MHAYVTLLVAQRRLSVECDTLQKDFTSYHDSPKLLTP